LTDAIQPDSGSTDAAACEGKCTQGTTCTTGRCQVISEPGCDSPIEVDARGASFFGEVCPDASPEVVMCSGAVRPAHVFAVPVVRSFTSAQITAVDSLSVKLLPASCVASAGQGCDSMGVGASKPYDLGADVLLAVGASGSECAHYEVTFGR
jgi:hypothetical protein